MVYYEEDSDTDTRALLQNPSKSTTGLHHTRDKACCTGRACCRHQERQLGTPTKFKSNRDGAEWMDEYEEIARANNWSDQAKLDIIPIYFDRRATKLWFRENRLGWQGDFETFKAAFLARFGRDAVTGRLVDPAADVDRRQENIETWVTILVMVVFLGLVIFLAYVFDVK